MTSNERTPLEESIVELTRWPAESEAALWSRLAAPPQRLWWGKPPVGLGVAAALLVVVGLIVAGSVLPTIGRARSSVSMEALTAARVNYSTPATSPAEAPAPSAPSSDSQPSAAVSIDRMVIRKATMELATDDVRGTFAKVALVVSEAQGEFVQDSSLTGDDATPNAPSTLHGQLTLRVAASSLPQVMQSLRGLGRVTSESATGEDVTDQVVDIEARLTNERRIEQELLRLLESRKDAPLAEVLQVSESLNRVRENIERMTAQRDRLSRMVSLATILVIVRAEREQGVSEQPFWQRTQDTLGRSLKDGVRSLVGSLGWLLEVLIGGLVFWVLLAVAVVTARIAWRRAKRRRAEEPPPVI